MLALFKRHPIAGTGFVLATVATLFFAFQLIAGAIYWADPEHRNQPPAGWMTPAYIAHSWDLDNRALRDHLGITRDDVKGRPTLKRIAEAKGVSVAEVIEEVNAFLDQAK